MSMKQWWDDNEREKPKYLKWNPRTFHFTHQNPHIYWSAIEHVSLWWEAGDSPPGPWCGVWNLIAECQWSSELIHGFTSGKMEPTLWCPVIRF